MHASPDGASAKHGRPNSDLQLLPRGGKSGQELQEPRAGPDFALVVPSGLERLGGLKHNRVLFLLYRKTKSRSPIPAQTASEMQ